ncbi:CRP-like cAMP-binding protein [Flavobacterium araucananum]|uniref:Cyclic nucleotide-binding protein n=1 Tax=Flavobacterium araucananum TaxID=946678 RepID=A0A227P594_9FLAO|nr:Crp/Fnr family transcriptional regulator [Flavobacterium araucananum]OXG05087.1 cyclic nucleotide-binding protein [Flavobacterium araucananum]PWJ96803.1 CRP-like cAMP-binding protein [Flavobacterium araucananum]
MHEPLLAYFKNYSVTPLTEEEINTIKKIFIPKTFRKRQYLLQEGDVCKYMAFITKGAMRQYTVDKKGVEHIVNLTIENWWAGDRESFVQLTTSPFFIDAWEETDVLMLSKADSIILESIPAFQEARINMNYKHSFALLNRLKNYTTLPAEQRYMELEKSYPEFLQRFPQHIIASFLGVTKETLSRVRKKT